MQGSHTWKVKVDSLPKLGVLKSPSFEVAGLVWHLGVQNGVTEFPDSLCMYLYAGSREADTNAVLKSRQNTKFTLKVINFDNLKNSVTRDVETSFTPDASNFGNRDMMPFTSLLDPYEGFLDHNGNVQLLVSIACPMAAEADQAAAKDDVSLAEPPAASLSGTTLLVLEGNKSLRAHALHLEQASDIFRGALECLQPAAGAAGSKPESEQASDEAAPVTHSLPLPGVTMHQALLLLHCMYAWARESWASCLSLPDLLDLARLADRYACTSVLRLVDSTILKRCKAQDGAGPDAILTVQSAPEQHRLAQELHLRAYQTHVGFFMGLNADEIDLTQVDDSYADILRGASKICTELLGRVLASNK